MQINELPKYDASVNTTGCCPKFNPEGWDGQELHLKDKPFLRAETRSAMHVPINMGKVFTRVQKHLDEADALDPDEMIVLSQDLSAWKGEHLFAVTKPVEGEEMVTLSGDYITKVFEGPYRQAKQWHAEMKDLASSKGKEDGKVFFFYTTCPKCAKAYGQNYIVGVAEI